MELYYEMLKKVNNLELQKKGISEIADIYGFEILPKNENNIIPGERYNIFNAKKEIDGYVIELQIDTKDKYKSGGNDEEPYFNKIRISKDNKTLDFKEYVYYE